MKKVGMLGFVLVVSLALAQVALAFDLLEPFTAEEIMAFKAQISPGVWFSSMSGDGIAVSDVAGYSASKVDFNDTLGMKGDKTNFAGRVIVQPWRKHKIRFGFTPLSYNGSVENIADVAKRLGVGNVQNLPVPIYDQWGNFLGPGPNEDFLIYKNKAIRGQVLSSADFNFYEIGYEYDFLLQEKAFLGGIIDLNLLDVQGKASLTTSSDIFRLVGVGTPLGFVGNLTHKASLLAPLPTIGLGGRYYPHERVGIGGEIKGIYAGSYASMLDLEVSLEINVIKNFAIEGGYRYIYLDFDINKFNGNLTLDGPFVKASFRF